MANSKQDLLTKDMLKSLFEYRDGSLFWRKNPSLKKSFNIIKPAGYKAPNGRFMIRINKRLYYRSHLVFLYHYGCWPKPQVDHINRVKDDDRIENLRVATQSLNSRNKNVYNNTGLKSVYSIKRKNGPYYMFYINKAILKCSYSLDKVVAYRDNWIKQNGGVAC